MAAAATEGVSAIISDAGTTSSRDAIIIEINCTAGFISIYLILK